MTGLNPSPDNDEQKEESSSGDEYSDSYSDNNGDGDDDNDGFGDDDGGSVGAAEEVSGYDDCVAHFK